MENARGVVCDKGRKNQSSRTLSPVSFPDFILRAVRTIRESSAGHDVIPSGLEKIPLTVVCKTDWRGQEWPQETSRYLLPRTFSTWSAGPLQNRAPLLWGCLFQFVLKSKVAGQQELCCPYMSSPILSPNLKICTIRKKKKKPLPYHLGFTSVLQLRNNSTAAMCEWRKRDIRRIRGLSLISFLFIDLFQGVRKQILSLRC